MSNVRDSLQEALASVRGTVRDTMESVKGTVEDTMGAVKHTAGDLREMVDRYPWLFVGGFAALGYLGYRLLASKSPVAQKQGYMRPAMESPSGGSPASEAPRPHNGHGKSWERAAGEEPASARVEGGKVENWPNVLEEMKALAIGVPMSILRDRLAIAGAETFRTQVTDIIDALTTRLGGKVIHDRG